MTYMKLTKSPKNLLYVSKDALITDIAWQSVKEGHNVKYYIGDKSQNDIGDGFVKKLKTGRKILIGQM